jgi:hypothetical protein
MATAHDPDDDTKELPIPVAHVPPVRRPASPPQGPSAADRQTSPPAAAAGREPARQWQELSPPPGYWHAARYPTNPLVILAAMVLLVFGLVVTLIGILGLIGGVFLIALLGDLLTTELAIAFDLDAFATLALVAFGVVLIGGVLHLLASIGIFMHRSWARALGMLLAALGTLLGGVGIAFVMQDVFPGQDVGRALSVPAIVAVGYGLTLFALIVGGNHFRRRY